MTRKIRDWTPELASASEVAPHRYTWNMEEPEVTDYRSWVASVPYKRGEVVYVARDGAAVKARIVAVGHEYDRFGDRRAVFRVQLETAKGLWAKSFVNTYPGSIQRGYCLAGLAPDCEGKL